MSKTCSKCQQTKEDTEFNKDDRSVDHLSWWCKSCSRAQSKKYRLEHLEERRTKEREKRANPDDRQRARNYYHDHKKEYHDYVKAHPEIHRRSALKTFYKLTMAEYDKMLIRQDGKCAICRKPQDAFKKPLLVDHDHSTGAVRGLLCPNCNHGLGRFGDSLLTLTNAMMYLKRVVDATAASTEEYVEAYKQLQKQEEKGDDVKETDIAEQTKLVETPKEEVKVVKPKYPRID